MADCVEDMRSRKAERRRRRRGAGVVTFRWNFVAPWLAGPPLNPQRFITPVVPWCGTAATQHTACSEPFLRVETLQNTSFKASERCPG